MIAQSYPHVTKYGQGRLGGRLQYRSGNATDRFQLDRGSPFGADAPKGSLNGPIKTSVAGIATMSLKVISLKPPEVWCAISVTLQGKKKKLRLNWSIFLSSTSVHTVN